MQSFSIFCAKHRPQLDIDDDDNHDVFNDDDALLKW